MTTPTRATPFTVGSVYEVRYPFLRTTFIEFEGTDDQIEMPSWKPGTEYVGTDEHEHVFHRGGRRRRHAVDRGQCSPAR